MKIEILGTGCSKCSALEEKTKQAINKIGGFHELIKVDDLVKIMDYNVLSMPALVVDGVVKSSGKSLSTDEIVEILKNH